MPHDLPSGVARGPDGRFVSADEAGFDDIEVATFRSAFGVESSDITDVDTQGGDQHTTEGVEVIDYDELVDRNESLVLLRAEHHLNAYIGGSAGDVEATQYGIAAVMAEISASPAVQVGSVPNPSSGSVVGTGTGDVNNALNFDDSIDLIGRPLSVSVSQDFSESAGAGGAGNSGANDQVIMGMPPAEFGRFHPRDELFAAIDMRLWNVDVSGITAVVMGQHVYGVLSD